MHALAILYELANDCVNGEWVSTSQQRLHISWNLCVLQIKSILQCSMEWMQFSLSYYFVCNANIPVSWVLSLGSWILDLEPCASRLLFGIRMNCHEIFWFVARSAHAKMHANRNVLNTKKRRIHTRSFYNYALPFSLTFHHFLCSSFTFIILFMHHAHCVRRQVRQKWSLLSDLSSHQYIHLNVSLFMTTGTCAIRLFTIHVD